MSATSTGVGLFRGLRRLKLLRVVLALALAVGVVVPVGAASGQQAAVPGQPARLRVHTEAGSLVVSAVWEDVAGADDYHVQWRAFGADTPLNDGERVAESQAQITVDGYGVWVVRVRACNDAGCGRPESKRFTVTPPNQAPIIDTSAEHYAGFVETQNAPRGIWVSKQFDGIFTDPEGDPLVYSVTVADDRAVLVDQVLIHPSLPRVFFRAEADSNWGAILPPLESPAITAVTLTATDPGGLSASVTGYMRTLWAPDSAADLGLLLDGDHERIAATWQAVTGAAKYLVQWAAAGESYDGTRQFEVPGGQLSPSAAIEGLNNDTSYTVRITALDDQGQEITAEEQTAQPVSARDYIEANFIDPHKEQFPWLAEAWYSVPVTIDVLESGKSSYDHSSHTAHLNRADIDDRLVVTRQLAHHYLRSPQILEDSPEGRLLILSLWLHIVDLRNRLLIPIRDDGSSAIDALVEYTLGGGDADFADDQTLAIVAGASTGQIAQWYYNTYTSAGTVETTQLNKLWIALGDVGMNLFAHPESARSVFGGFCSEREAQFFQFITLNPWVGGGCVNQKVQNLTVAEAPVAGELRVSWYLPVYAGYPEFDHYAIQWKSDTEDYDETRQATIPKDGGWGDHAITGLTPGTEYTIRVAPFNEEDDSMFTNSEGHSRAREITATVPVPPLAISLSRLDGQITAAWAPYGVPVAKYVVQWRSGDQSYDESRQREVPGGQESYSVTIDGLDNNTAYTVRVAALDDQGQELSADEQTVQRWSAFDHIETAFIDPYMDEHPWLAEAWYEVPVKIRVKESGNSTYHQNSHTINLNRADVNNRLVVTRKLAYHYLTHGDVHADDPEAMLSVLSMWLHEFDRIRTARSGENVCLSAKRSLGDFTTLGDAADIPNASTASLAASVSQGEIPQWFYDTYTADGTLDSVDLEGLWDDIVYSRRDSCLYNLSEQTSGLFGGHCSLDEARAALRNNSYPNPWADGGCLNRRPLGVSAEASAVGELTVTWNPPPHAMEPAIDAYTVQWKSGDQDYDSTRQAIVTDLEDLSHIITGLTTGIDYTVRVAAVNQADTNDHTDEDGHSRAGEITATVLGPALNLSLEGIANHVFVDWSPQFLSAASYRVQWRSGDQAYDETRQKEAPGGTEAQTVIIEGLDNDTTYTVRLAAFDGDGIELLAEEMSIPVVTAHKYIEDHIIAPLLEDNPWMQEAWFDVPVGIHLLDYEPGKLCAAYLLYDPDNPKLQFCSPFRAPRWPVVHELGHHYTINPYIHADDPAAKLSVLSLWLHQTQNYNPNYPVSEAVVELLLRAGSLDYHGGKLGVGRQAAAVARAAQQQQIPQWFYDTYTTDNTLDTTDLELLWADLRDARRNGYFQWYAPKSVSVVFGGYCSFAEGTWALETAEARNAWVDGGCVNRPPQNLSAAPGGAGELVVTWQAPLWSTTPDIDGFLVQWKSGDQDYNSTRQAVVTDLDNLTHTITGLTAGTEYMIRVAAVNQADTADFADDDGRARTAESSGTAG